VRVERGRILHPGPPDQPAQANLTNFPAAGKPHPDNAARVLRGYFGNNMNVNRC
jgi:hypothetical protein